MKKHESRIIFDDNYSKLDWLSDVQGMDVCLNVVPIEERDDLEEYWVLLINSRDKSIQEKGGLVHASLLPFLTSNNLGKIPKVNLLKLVNYLGPQKFLSKIKEVTK